MKKINSNIVIIDYGIGNVKSIANAFENIGVNTLLSSNKEEILSADALVLPGVGAFSTGMKNLEEKKLIDTIYNFVGSGKPFLGICLGMQMLLEESEEFGYSKGLGLIEGKVVQFPLTQNCNEKLPHVGWNEIIEPSEKRWKTTILENTPNKTDVYFVHSFVAVPKNQDNILALSGYGGVPFCAAVQKKNVFGTQFHPEKSGKIGLEILEMFTSLIKINQIDYQL